VWWYYINYFQLEYSWRFMIISYLFVIMTTAVVGSFRFLPTFQNMSVRSTYKKCDWAKCQCLLGISGSHLWSQLLEGAEIGRIMVWGQPRQILHVRSHLKIARTKWTGGVAQAIEHLLCKCEVLSPNSSSTPPKCECLFKIITIWK
jgi:hypothetical protein